MLYETDEGSRQEFLRLLAEQGEEPAFLRRARGLTAALDNLDRKIERERLAMLHGPRLHLRKLAAIINQDWSKLTPHLRAPACIEHFPIWFEQWNRDMPVPEWAGKNLFATSVLRTLRDLNASIETFNKAWIQPLARKNLFQRTPKPERTAKLAVLVLVDQLVRLRFANLKTVQSACFFQRLKPTNSATGFHAICQSNLLRVLARFLEGFDFRADCFLRRWLHQ